ncbi:MarR family winged helix-turn-helix transcriptional regulator [Congregibacter brevis]|uniref:MarR family winged helix-turn-helix transcriptional regulator n=1 Tax=Congregibacter brevis TaxID=3081201 RepID=A0ABZ0IC42_9GAMM|nr:MarR family winged helix-turn-helix transcriptional regulator [Congregibacter sp. IMCC45268]
MKKFFQLEGFLPYRFDRLAKHISVSFAEVYRRRFNITVPQWRILALLHETPHLSSKAIAQQGNLDKVMVSRAVADLEARGLLKRYLSSGDGRVNELCLTLEGTRLFESIAPLALRWEEDFLGVLEDEDRRDLVRILQRLEEHAKMSVEMKAVMGGATR